MLSYLRVDFEWDLDLEGEDLEREERGNFFDLDWVDLVTVFGLELWRTLDCAIATEDMIDLLFAKIFFSFVGILKDPFTRMSFSFSIPFFKAALK